MFPPTLTVPAIRNAPERIWARCRCCGRILYSHEVDDVPPEAYRCRRHLGKNPCVIDECERGRKAKHGLGVGHVICGEHWRRYIPPGSPGRRALNRLARTARKLGYKRTDRWPPDLEDRYWRLWTGLLRRAQRQSTEGRIDMTEINKLFGWDDAG